MFEKRISIFTGHFGSGKTEVAVNYAIQMAEIYKKVAIVDFDIVNPFFRTADVKKELESKGIKLIAPMFANTNVDVPSLPAEINTIFENKEYKAVFDIGGDDLGAKVLSRYNKNILSDDYEMYFVINIRRPMTIDELGIENMICEIEESSRLKVSKLVNNTNLLAFTTAEEIEEGEKVIQKISKKLNIPIAFTSGMKDIMDKLEPINGSEKLFMDKYIKLLWE
jgi:cellulose biosynthesis protein BcsQ